MIFHENRLLADNSHVISYLIFVENWEKYCKICRLCSRDWRFKGLTYTDDLTDMIIHLLVLMIYVNNFSVTLV